MTENDRQLNNRQALKLIRDFCTKNKQFSRSVDSDSNHLLAQFTSLVDEYGKDDTTILAYFMH